MTSTSSIEGLLSLQRSLTRPTTQLTVGRVGLHCRLSLLVHSWPLLARSPLDGWGRAGQKRPGLG